MNACSARNSTVYRSLDMDTFSAPPYGPIRCLRNQGKFSDPEDDMLLECGLSAKADAWGKVWRAIPDETGRWSAVFESLTPVPLAVLATRIPFRGSINSLVERVGKNGDERYAIHLRS